MTLREQVEAVVRRIPAGRVASYGWVGAQLEEPLSGWRTGRIMATVREDAPWWRVVARDGRLPVGKKSMGLALEQAERLGAEGVRVTDWVVGAEFFLD